MDTFTEFCESKAGKKGTYVAVKYSAAFSRSLRNQMKQLGVPNIIDIDKIHSTLIYSRVELNGFKPMGGMRLTFDDNTVIPHTFKTSSGKTAFVLKLKPNWYILRHKQIMKEYPEATYDFDEYIPHITVSYDVGDWENPTGEIQLDSRIEIVQEYSEVLDLDWKA